MKRTWLLLMVLLISISLTVGCQGFSALRLKPEATQAIEKAQASFDELKAAGAETKAPFEYYAAEAYLDMAKHELGENDFDVVSTFASESEKYAAQALEKVRGGAK